MSSYSIDVSNTIYELHPTVNSPSTATTPLLGMFNPKDYQSFAVPYGGIGVVCDILALFMTGMLGHAGRSPLVLRKLHHPGVASILLSLGLLFCTALHVYNIACGTGDGAKHIELKLIACAKLALTLVGGISSLLSTLRCWRLLRASRQAAERSGTVDIELQRTGTKDTEETVVTRVGGGGGVPDDPWNLSANNNNNHNQNLTNNNSFGLPSWLSNSLLFVLVPLVLGACTAALIFANAKLIDILPAEMLRVRRTEENGKEFYVSTNLIMVGLAIVVPPILLVLGHVSKGGKLRHLFARSRFLINETALEFAACFGLGFGLLSLMIAVISADILVGVASSAGKSDGGVHRSSDVLDVVRYWVYVGFCLLPVFST